MEFTNQIFAILKGQHRNLCCVPSRQLTCSCLISRMQSCCMSSACNITCCIFKKKKLHSQLKLQILRLLIRTALIHQISMPLSWISNHIETKLKKLPYESRLTMGVNNRAIAEYLNLIL